MKPIHLLALLAVAIATPSPSVAADADGKFIVAGPAEIGCTDFAAAMDRARKNKVGSETYIRETQGFAMYLLGFRTGYNMAGPDTYDIFPGDEGEQPLLARAEYFCRLHPTYKFADAVVAVARDRQEKRQRSATQ